MEAFSRRIFIKQSGLLAAGLVLPLNFTKSVYTDMKETIPFDVIIIGGSYSGLAAGMALGRSLRRVLIIDSGEPCNRQTPHSHNFLTQDGNAPQAIAAIARRQVEAYDSVQFLNGQATKGLKGNGGFEITVASGNTFRAKKLIFATGIRDIMPEIPGFSECWGISVIHCPYCHGYEVRHKKTGILMNSEHSFEFAGMIRHWTSDLALYTNGPSALSPEQAGKLKAKNISIVEKEIERIEHQDGHLKQLMFKDGSAAALDALYGPRPFELHCRIPETLGCELSEEGYVKVDGFQKTSVQGVFACGDATTRMRTIAGAVAAGAAAGMMLNKELIAEEF